MNYSNWINPHVWNDIGQDILDELDTQQSTYDKWAQFKRHCPELTHWHPAEFISQYFYVYDTEALFVWHPSQLHAFHEATKRDQQDRFKYHTVLWSWPKKSAKSTIIAAIVDYLCLYTAKAHIRLIGNDLRQADSRVGYYLRENIKIGARKGYGLSEQALALQEIRRDTHIRPSGYNIEYPNGSIVEMVPIDPSGEAGGNDDLVVFSELWGWKHKSHRDMWTELTISPNRFGQAQRWIDTYAGFEGDSPILEELYSAVVSDETRIKIPHNAECYAQSGIFATWVTKHLLEWQSEDYYQAERATLTPEQFNRLHNNQWVTSENAFVPIAWWDQCAGTIPTLLEYEEIVIALDAGISSDCFAIVAVSRDRRYESQHLDTGEDIAPNYFVLRYARKWTPPKGQKLKFESDTPEDITPASEIKRLVEHYNVVQVAYDPWQLEHFVSQKASELQTWFESFGQITEREIADKQLYDIIRNGRIVYDPRNANMQDMRDHLQNAAADIRGDDRKLRIVKRDEKRKIDLAVALSMACKRCNDLVPK